jgi:hypothetical protein
VPGIVSRLHAYPDPGAVAIVSPRDIAKSG